MWQHVLFWWGKGDVKQTAVKNILIEIMSVDLTCQTRLNLWMKTWESKPKTFCFEAPFPCCYGFMLNTYYLLPSTTCQPKKIQASKSKNCDPRSNLDPSILCIPCVNPTTQRGFFIVPWQEVGAGVSRVLCLFLLGTQKSTKAARGSSMRCLRDVRPGNMQIQV